MASTSGLRLTDAKIQNVTPLQSILTNGKSIPAILSRKRKADHLDMDLMDLGCDSGYVDPSENVPPSYIMQPAKRPNRNVQKPEVASSSSRMPLATLSSNVSIRMQMKPRVKPVVADEEQQKRLSPVQSNCGSSSQPKKLKLRQSWAEFREFVRQTSQDQSSPRGVSRFPQMSWADRQSVWDSMYKKERGMYRRQSSDLILARHPCLQPRMRAILFDWLKEVCEVYRLHRETFHLAVDFFDRYLGTTNNLQKTSVQLVGISCLFIAAKIEEIYPPKLSEFAFVTDGACSEDDILHMELVILKGLNWGLSPMTTNSWVKLYMQINEANVKTDFVLPQFCGRHFVKVMQLLDLCLLDMGCLAFPYSVLAASAIYHCQDQPSALHPSGYSWNDIESCVSWMSPFMFALREARLDEADLPFKAKASLLDSIKEDNVHNIQVHTVDLAVLDRAQERLALMEEARNRRSPDLLPPMMVNLGMTPPEAADDVINFTATSTNVPCKTPTNSLTSSSVLLSPNSC